MNNTYIFPVIQEVKTGKKLKEMRMKNGIKVSSVCKSMGGISAQAVYKWERGDGLPTIDNLLALSILYNARMEDLLVYERTEISEYSL